jgi:hypothetical protein
MAPIEQRGALVPPGRRAGTGGRGGHESATPAPTTGVRADTESLIRGLEVLVGRQADPDRPMPLGVLGRYERALAQGHRSNLLRLAVIEERVLALPEE